MENDNRTQAQKDADAANRDGRGTTQSNETSEETPKRAEEQRNRDNAKQNPQR